MERLGANIVIDVKEFSTIQNTVKFLRFFDDYSVTISYLKDVMFTYCLEENIAV